MLDSFRAIQVQAQVDSTKGHYSDALTPEIEAFRAALGKDWKLVGKPCVYSLHQEAMYVTYTFVKSNDPSNKSNKPA